MQTFIVLAVLVCARALPAAAQDSFEQRLLAVPDTASARLMTYDLTRVPHVAGTPAQAATRDYVIDKVRAWGLEAWRPGPRSIRFISRTPTASPPG
ncbi:MAG: hypothetical protein E6K55_06170 [Gemmatimonadetes bacterium]|nr:MAG: hypothetical protein DMD67_06960 [Gemmatimonadota bacterium]PYO98346.1 MAG: hypothetical protein DMD61_10245 [Gemmatimonadota bacterium]TLY54268.1 MAG: hypothetical protein E6K55_06170 [Gemmatimonadota bacterium]